MEAKVERKRAEKRASAQKKEDDQKKARRHGKICGYGMFEKMLMKGKETIEANEEFAGPGLFGRTRDCLKSPQE